MDGLYALLKPLLFALDPETAHDSVAGLLRLAATLPAGPAVLSALGAPAGPAKTVFGLKFPSPVGLAAGFDKNGSLATILPALGFGFVEIGSVTLEPQPGNPKPRMFRLPAERALINRMGFNSLGVRQVVRILSSQPRPSIPLGINLGLNKGTPPGEAPSSYARLFSLLRPFGDYFVINVSSPNTPGLRALQTAADLSSILAAVQSANPGRKPVLVKLSPDLADEDLAECVAASDKAAAGFVVSNTTIAHAGEAGGLSGAPLKARALALTRKVRALTTLPIVGAGGIASAEDARERLAAGADLVQLYTGLVYGGPRLPAAIARGLAR